MKRLKVSLFPYFCPRCGRRFRRRAGVDQHRRRAHAHSHA